MPRPIEDDEDREGTGVDEAAAKESVAKVVDKDPTADLPMHVSEDGTITFGESDARGERSAKADADDEEEEAHDPTMTDAQREQLREKRRQEKRRRREAAKQRETELRGEAASLRQQNQQLANRLQQLEQRTTGIDVARIDEELRGAEYAYNSWKAAFETAVRAADGATATAAMEKMQQAKEEGQRLFNTKQAIVQNTGAQMRPTVPPEVLAKVDRWRAKHSWYNPLKPDQDTRLTLAIDAQVGADGFDAGTDEFWVELDKRLKKVLPHRYETQDDEDDDGEDPAPRGGRNRSGDADSVRPSAGNRRVPAAGGGSGSAAAGAGFKLSPERVQAMKDGGVWNDPKKRETAIRAYINYDKAQKARGN
jgi:hypothetical protein